MTGVIFAFEAGNDGNDSVIFEERSIMGRPKGLWYRMEVSVFREFMKSSGLTLKDIAKDTGISERTLYRALKEGKISVANVRRIGKAYGKDYKEIFGYDDSPEANLIRAAFRI